MDESLSWKEIELLVCGYLSELTWKSNNYYIHKAFCAETIMRNLSCLYNGHTPSNTTDEEEEDNNNKETIKRDRNRMKKKWKRTKNSNKTNKINSFQ